MRVVCVPRAPKPSTPGLCMWFHFRSFLGYGKCFSCFSWTAHQHKVTMTAIPTEIYVSPRGSYLKREIQEFETSNHRSLPKSLTHALGNALETSERPP